MDKLPRLLVVVLRPVEVEVDRLLRLLLVVLCAVDRLPRLLVVVLRPVEVEVDRLLKPVLRLALDVLSCATVTASLISPPSATLVIRRVRFPALLPTETTDEDAATFV